MKPEFWKFLEAKIKEVDAEVVLVGTEEEVAQTQTQAKVDFDYIAIVKADSQELCSQSNHHAELVAILSADPKPNIEKAIENFPENSTPSGIKIFKFINPKHPLLFFQLGH